MNQCLTMCGVWKSYDAGVRGCSATVTVLRDISLEVSAGQTVCIAAGPASGKTTLLMCGGGLMRPDRGLVSWFGGPPRRDNTARPEGIAYAGDRPFPYGFLTIREAVEYAAIVRDLPLRDSAHRVIQVLDHCGLAAIAHRRVDTLEGNALARLSVATALLARPRLILVDDFVPGCDADTARELMTTIQWMVNDGAAVVMASRFVSRIGEALVASARLYTLVAGRLEPVTEHADVPTGLPTPAAFHAHTRVAESPPRSSPRENRAQ